MPILASFLCRTRILLIQFDVMTLIIINIAKYSSFTSVINGEIPGVCVWLFIYLFFQWGFVVVGLTSCFRIVFFEWGNFASFLLEFKLVMEVMFSLLFSLCGCYCLDSIFYFRFFFFLSCFVFRLKSVLYDTFSSHINHFQGPKRKSAGFF